MVLVALVQLAPPKVIGIIIDEIAEKEISIETILFWIGILLAAALAQYIFRFVWRINIWGVLHAWKKLTSSIIRSLHQNGSSFLSKTSNWRFDGPCHQ